MVWSVGRIYTEKEERGVERGCARDKKGHILQERRVFFLLQKRPAEKDEKAPYGVGMCVLYLPL